MRSGRIVLALILFAIAACLFPFRAQHAAQASFVSEPLVIGVSADRDLSRISPLQTNLFR